MQSKNWKVPFIYSIGCTIDTVENGYWYCFEISQSILLTALQQTSQFQKHDNAQSKGQVRLYLLP